MKQIVDWEQMEAAEMERLARFEQMDSKKRWAKYPRPNPFSECYGFGSSLYKLRGDMNNYKLTPLTRQYAANAFYKIIRQLEDKKLMSLRERLIRASRVGDEPYINLLTKQMRYHLREDQETGMYDT